MNTLYNEDSELATIPFLSDNVQHPVLIADDNQHDRFFLKRAIETHAPNLNVVAEVEDGDEVIAYLWGYGEYSDRQKFPFPELLILDMRMPRMNGMHVLEWLATQDFPTLKVAARADLSAVIFKDRALKLGVDHFYPKMANLDELGEMVRTLQTELELNSAGRFI